MPVGAIGAATALAQALDRIAAAESRIKRCAGVEGRLVGHEMHCMIVALEAASKRSHDGVISYPLQFRAFAGPDLDVVMSSPTCGHWLFETKPPAPRAESCPTETAQLQPFVAERIRSE